jgi:hypothetical protein
MQAHVELYKNNVIDSLSKESIFTKNQTTLRPVVNNIAHNTLSKMCLLRENSDGESATLLLVWFQKVYSVTSNSSKAHIFIMFLQKK